MLLQIKLNKVGKIMKNKTKFIVICMIIMLCPMFRVHADSGGYLIKFQEGHHPNIYEYNLKEVNADRGIYLSDNLEDLKPIEDYIEYTSQNSAVTLIEGEETISPFSLPEDELYSEQWQLQLINADAGWELETYGNDIKVAVIDSGCFEHEDLKYNLLEGKNYLTGTTDVTDNNGHGTHVSGIIAAEMNDFGIVGVAPKAKIVPLKCFDPSHDTYVEDILDAIYDAVDVYDCRIINMSWGLKNDDPFLQEAIDYADSKDVILIAAVGNYGSTTMYYPAAYENVIGVSSVGIEKNKSSFAQYNKSVLITASGEKVKSTYKDGNYQVLQGTSQATPMVSGIAAVALSMNENLTSDEFRQLLIETAEDLGDEGYDVKFGYGLANEDALLNRLMRDMEYYVSPINICDDEAYALIKNNTESILKASSIFSKYNNGKFVGCNQIQITLLPGKEIMVKTGNNSNKISHFLWSGMTDLTPLTSKRERE